MTAIIDYGAGNIRSVQNALQYLGEEAVLTSDPSVILSADHVILPGVGSFGDAMERLRSADLTGVIRKVCAGGTPFLGICLGLQLLFEQSILPGRIVRIPEETDSGTRYKVPEIGWNSLTYPHHGRLFSGVPEGAYVYFVHSYYLQCADSSLVTARTKYSTMIDASVEKGNVFACQFHPEKSEQGVNFVSLRDAGDPVEAGEAYSKAGADELVFLDITATSDARATVTDMVRRVAQRVFIPFTVGGGIRSVDDMKAILREGADKISVNSAAVERPELIAEGAERFGSQCIVTAIDARRRVPEEGRAWEPSDGWTVYTAGGRHDTGLDAVAWAKKAVSLGSGELLVTSMDCDGTKSGYDIALTRAISDAVPVPVIASGGAGTKEHFLEALTEGGADAALAASLFHFKELEISTLKEYLDGQGIPVRL